MGVDQLAQALVRGGADVLHGPQHALHEGCDVPLPSRKPLKARHMPARPCARPCKGHSQQRRLQQRRPHLHANPAMTMHTRSLRHCCTGSVTLEHMPPSPRTARPECSRYLGHKISGKVQEGAYMSGWCFWPPSEKGCTMDSNSEQ